MERLFFAPAFQANNTLLYKDDSGLSTATFNPQDVVYIYITPLRSADWNLTQEARAAELTSIAQAARAAAAEVKTTSDARATSISPKKQQYIYIYSEGYATTA
jgi:hypothetical protein